MAIVVLGRNGIGLGHQARLASLCDALRSVRQSPVFLCQGSSHKQFLTSDTTWALPYISTQSEAAQEVWRRNVERYANLSNPAVVIEDTHPCGISFSKEVSRVLIIRPLCFKPMMAQLTSNTPCFDRFIVADHPESPTWPYSNDETAALLKIENLTIAGPIFRTPSREAISSVRQRYRVTRQQKIFLFSLGGGGDHENANDAETFVDAALVAGRRLKKIDPGSRLIFVKGPLFPRCLDISSDFEIVEIEPQMPALFHLAQAAMIRLGFNSVWEAISGKTPIIPFIGTSHQEPMAQRLDKLIHEQIAFHEVGEAWSVDKFRETPRSPIHMFSKRWNGKPSESTLAIIVQTEDAHPEAIDSQPMTASLIAAEPKPGFDLERYANESSDVINISARSPIRSGTTILPLFKHSATDGRTMDQGLHWSPHNERCDYLMHQYLDPDFDRVLGSPFRQLDRPPDLVVRVDDVIDLHDGLRSFVKFAASMNIHLSLEVIPFHCTLTVDQLRPVIDGSKAVIEIGQHGFSHVPYDGFLGDNAEFDPYSERPCHGELEALRAGKVLLQQRFGGLFKGGYSAPFDRLSPWLPEAWHQLGGNFLSHLWGRPNGARIKSIKMQVEPWDWENNASRSAAAIFSEICSFTSLNGYVGIVLHQQHLRDIMYRDRVCRLLTVLIDAGFSTRTMCTLAGFQASLTQMSPYRNYLRERATL